MKKELLAPAGDIEAGYAAVYYGADAVYLGLRQFSARATATNFDEAELNEFVGFAHSKGRRVYVAVNTLVLENELDDLLETLDICVRCRADAVILQDLGAARVVREKYPELEMHASTQMAVHNREGALALQKLGFSRVVVARELNRDEIEKIAAIPGLEIEAFIHGALCYSYSGLCLFSSLEMGKSANRGKCLYPCRACFKGESGEKHYFSMKDMALEEDVLKMPAYSLKIEGRKKSALYVAAVTDFYRRLLDGKGKDQKRADNIKQIFSRPWCKFYFHGRDKSVVDRDFIGHRGLFVGTVEQVSGNSLRFCSSHAVARHDGLQIETAGFEKPFGFSVRHLRAGGRNVFEAKAGELVEIGLPPGAPLLQPGDKIYLASSSEVKGAYPYEKPKPGIFRQKKKIDVDVVVSSNKIAAKCLSFEVFFDGRFEAAKDSAKMFEAVKKSFAKTGETNFVLGNLTVDNPQNLFVPASQLNELRRKLYAAVVVEKKAGVLPSVDSARVKKAAKLIVKTDRAASLAKIDLERVDEIIFVLEPKTTVDDLKNLPKQKIRLALPEICRNPEIFHSTVSCFWAQGFRKWEVSNYWGVEMLSGKKADISFDRQIYMMNTQAVQEAKTARISRVTLSVEDVKANLLTLCEKTPLPVVLPVYADAALFESDVCIRSNLCKNCPRGEKWMTLVKDGRRYDVLSKNCQTMVFDARPYCIAAEAKSVPADYYRVDFLYRNYTAEQAALIFEKVCLFEDVSGDVLKGNLRRAI